MNKVILLIKENRKGIAISLIVGTFLFYMRPVLDFIGLQFVNFLAAISDTFSSYFYSRVAENNPYIFQERNNYFLTLALYLVVYIFFSNFLKKQKNLLVEFIELKAKVSEQPQNTDLIETESDTLLQNTNISDTIDKKILALKKILKQARFAYIISMLLVVWFYSLHVIDGVVAKANMDFKKQMIMVRPYVGNDAVSLFEASWVMMDSKSDYDSLLSRIDRMGDLAIKNNKRLNELNKMKDSLDLVEKRQIDTLKILRSQLDLE